MALPPQRALFAYQAPLGILAGFTVFFSMPHFTHSYGGTPSSSKDATVVQKLAGIDYAGAFFLVRNSPSPPFEPTVSAR